VADDGEAEPRGADRPRLALREPLEDALALVRRDARAAVGDDYPYLAVVRGRLDRHPSAARRVAERVRHQVRERPRELRGVAGDRHAVADGRRLEGDAAFLGLKREDLGDPCQHLPEIDLLAV